MRAPSEAFSPAVASPVLPPRGLSHLLSSSLHCQVTQLSPSQQIHRCSSSYSPQVPPCSPVSAFCSCSWEQERNQREEREQMVLAAGLPASPHRQAPCLQLLHGTYITTVCGFSVHIIASTELGLLQQPSHLQVGGDRRAHNACSRRSRGY